MVVEVEKAYIKWKIQQQEQQLEYFLGLWPSAPDKNAYPSQTPHSVFSKMAYYEAK